MLISPIRPDVFLGSAVLPGDPQLPAERPRGRHARLLETAAARRRRALERRGSQRHEDAAYWLECAPVAVRKARSLRVEPGFAAIP